jgi:hypothetical protein
MRPPMPSCCARVVQGSDIPLHSVFLCPPSEQEADLEGVASPELRPPAVGTLHTGAPLRDWSAPVLGAPSEARVRI